MAVGSGASVASSMAVLPVPAASAEVDAGALLVPAGSDGGALATVKVKDGGAKKNDDPYDAVTPTVVKTAEAVVPLPTIPVAPAPPPPPSASSHLYSPVPQY